MPQGPVLGHILFVNTPTEVVKYLDLLFADYHKLFKIQTKQDSSLLQYEIDSMYNRTLNSLLLFYPKKFYHAC